MKEVWIVTDAPEFTDRTATRPGDEMPTPRKIGTAGWSVPRAVADRFPPGDSVLQRYAGRLTCTEINTTFYRPHQPGTYARWRDSTPADFRFAVKLRQTITHDARLVDCAETLAAFALEVAPLAEKLGALLVQLPPSLAFDQPVADRFFADLRRVWDGPVACEPRHATWFTPGAEALLTVWRIARVAADPPRHPTDGVPGGWPGLVYWRMHGSPRMYVSAYAPSVLNRLARSLRTADAEAWCIFDNTASGAAAADALALQALLAP
jgi:uncharacterized protein YecE (DUF72 family)